MNHIKSYKIFESELPEVQKQDVEDILLELNDVGFSLETHFIGGKSNIVFITVQKMINDEYKPFKFKEISEVIKRLYDYLPKDKKIYTEYAIPYESDIFGAKRDSWKHVNSLSSDLPKFPNLNDNIKYFTIEYTFKNRKKFR